MEYMGADMSFPDAEACLKVYLGCWCCFADQMSAFDAVFKVVDNILAPQAIVTITSSSPAAPAPSLNFSVAPFGQPQGLEANLIHVMAQFDTDWINPTFKL